MQHFKYSELLIICFFCLLAIGCPATIHGIISFACSGVIVSVLLLHFRRFLFQRKNVIEKKKDITLLVLSIAIAIGFFINFTLVWLPSSKVKAVLSALHIPQNIFVYALGIALAPGAAIFVYEALLLFLNSGISSRIKTFFLNQQELEITVESNRRASLSEKCIIFLCAILSITLCSCSSPLYPMNSWVDVNAYFTVGKGMLRGMVPYRDLFDHKGPFLFLLYGLASLISPDSLWGGYLLEIIAAYVYLLFSYRIASLHLKKKSIILVPLISVISYTSEAFEQGGCPEELCLAFMAYSLWLFLRDYVNENLRFGHFLMLGIMAGCIFWMKFTLIGIYIGWYIWMFLYMIRSGKIKNLVYRSIIIFCGVVLSTAPWVVYFGINGTLKDWIEVYIYDNLFVYTVLPAYTTPFARIPVFGTLSTGIASSFSNNPITTAVLMLFVVGMFQSRKEEMAKLYILTILGAFSSIFIGGRTYRYYSLPLVAFLAPSLSLLFSGIPENILGRVQRRTQEIAALCIVCMFVITPNRNYMKYKKEDLAQYQFRQIIEENNLEATILNYGTLDGGFYTVCDILPNCRAFYVANVLEKELLETQNIYVESGLCDYVVTKSTGNNGLTTDITTLEGGEGKTVGTANEVAQGFSLYDLVAECTCPANGVSKATFRLYRLKSLTE